ncbi:MAG: ribose 5-phosphate isomerase A [Nitrososphaerota archaeon]|jgi:ribose 5-phosphate isomerase A|nr:ribose 5-phosphate isomerase A [Nitrososphaerota archaeon]MDG6942239.1 ribose 5-phosphate isomerase A [Nitrososphaerota archaeon]MDG6942704.1 ribose 5-phosphate isomerase A [Nitrososphaerota archaeon]MDG6948491.1 ribose 5-phosphate isomerase A [Nitrososphaerota archaeon]MDG6950417.1 ribose 5-phosphate isomerase A [Nitrososphaerota archaeon]
MDRTRDALKGVARELAKSVVPGATLGLGSGSTVAALLEELSALVMARSKAIMGVPTSTQIEMVATRCGIELVPFKGSVDLAIDGADQVDGGLNLIKGGGGALLREKIIMGSAKSVAIVAGEGKFAKRLCENGVRVPVEVFPMARESAKLKLSMLGGVPEERLMPKGYPYFTENGNMILDTLFEPIEEPRELEVKVKSTPGVFEVGIFTVKPITAYKLKADGGFDTITAGD